METGSWGSRGKTAARAPDGRGRRAGPGCAPSSACVLMVAQRRGPGRLPRRCVARYAGAVARPRTSSATRRPGATKEPVSDIKGPLNILLVGIDPRNATTRAAGRLDHGRCTCPRPTGAGVHLLDPARSATSTSPTFDKTGFRGGPSKINAAMSYGSEVAERQAPDVAQGFELLAKTVAAGAPASSGSTPARSSTSAASRRSSTRWAASHDDRREVKSEHLQPNGKPRPRATRCGCEHPLHRAAGGLQEGQPAPRGLAGARLRPAALRRLPDADYDRQRHQQQFVKAMAEPGVEQGRGDQPDQARQGAARRRRVVDLQRPRAAPWSTAASRSRASAPRTSTLIKLPGAGIGNGSVPGRAAATRRRRLLHRPRQRARSTPFLLEHPEFRQQDQVIRPVPTPAGHRHAVVAHVRHPR